MSPFLEKVLATNQFVNSKGETIEIHSHTTRPQCEFLQKIIADNKFSRSIEIGLAYGISTVAILDEISKNNGKHVVMDIFQEEGWNNNGLDMIKQAGYESITDFRPQYCYDVLPALMHEGRKFDFAYIDSTKQFDWILIDFFYLDKILEVGGVIAFDDVNRPGIRKALRLISQFPSYKVYGTWRENQPQKKVKFFQPLMKLIPGYKKIFRDELLRTNYDLGINAHCVAIQKISEDKRNWDWFVHF
jgi:predicted O-methyltransferase YrrM